MNPGPPGGMTNVILGFSGSITMSGLYNPGNYPVTWTVTDPANRVSVPSAWTVKFTALANDWALLGPRSFTSALSGTNGVRS